MAKSSLKQFNTGKRSVSRAPSGSLDGDTRRSMTGTNGRALSALSKYERTSAALQGKQLPKHGMTTGMRGFKSTAGKITPSGRGIAQPNISDRALRTRLIDKGRKP
jgi:hypothetical protein